MHCSPQVARQLGVGVVSYKHAVTVNSITHYRQYKLRGATFHLIKIIQQKNVIITIYRKTLRLYPNYELYNNPGK